MMNQPDIACTQFQDPFGIFGSADPADLDVDRLPGLVHGGDVMSGQ